MTTTLRPTILAVLGNGAMSVVNSDLLPRDNLESAPARAFEVRAPQLAAGAHRAHGSAHLFACHVGVLGTGKKSDFQTFKT